MSNKKLGIFTLVSGIFAIVFSLIDSIITSKKINNEEFDDAAEKRIKHQTVRDLAVCIPYCVGFYVLVFKGIKALFCK